MITFRNFLKMYVTPQYLEKSLTLLRPQSNNCLVRFRIVVKKERVRGRGEGGIFLFVEAIPFSRGYYIKLDMASIEII